MINEINSPFANILLNDSKSDITKNDFPLQDELTLPNGTRTLGADGLETKMKGKFVTPESGFVLKTKQISNNMKTFINIVTHPDIDEPSMKKKLNDQGESVEGLNIPMSVGAGRDFIDKSDSNCVVYDIIVNPIVLNESVNDKTGKYRDFICQLSMQCIENKYKLELNKQYKLPKLKYIGYDNNNAIHQQYIQDRKNMPKIEEISSNTSNLNDKKVSKKIEKKVDIQVPIEEKYLSYHLKWLDKNNIEEDIENNLMNEYIDPIMILSDNIISLLYISEINSYTCNDNDIDIQLSPFIMKVKLPGYKQNKLYFPMSVDPSKSFYTIKRKEGFISIFQLRIELFIDHKPFDLLPDVGSKPWLMSQALSIDNDNITNSMSIYSNYNELNKSLNNNTFDTPPDILQNQVDLDNIELPEDKFHRLDAASSYIINQREQDVKNKIAKHEKEKAERMNDPNVEYIDMDDFKPGGKHETRTKLAENSINTDNTESTSSIPEIPIEIKKASEIVLSLTKEEGIINDGISSTYWTELLD